MESVDWRIRHWQKRLGLNKFVIKTERISPFQVADERTGRRSNNPFVGIVRIEDSAVILHTRRLRHEDIIHELLHLAGPEWNHEQVVEETERLKVS